VTSTAVARAPGAIGVLDSRVADQIAAGEVIERPASVVKELVENSLDAGASEIHVRVEAGGRTLIRVRDDGAGMSPVDAERACLRHATSKLRRIEDLTGIPTLGFRGEALASIAAVARVEIHTRPRAVDAGSRVVVEGGAVRERVPAGVPEGTTIEVSDLFAAVPARRKFLRTGQTEFGHIAEWLQRMALARPEVGFELEHGNRRVWRHPAVRRPADRVRQVLGAERVRDMVPVEWSERDVSIRGFVSRPGTSFSQARQISCFVDGRHVRDRVLLRAVQDAYRALLPHGRYPAAILFVELPGEWVDVNVHPTKTEVRFADPDAVFRAALRALRGAIAGPGMRARPAAADGPAEGDGVEVGAAGAVPSRVAEAMQRYVIRSERTGGDLRGRSYTSSGGASADGGRGGRPARPAARRRPGASSWSPGGDEQAPPERFASLIVLGQALNGYIVCAYSDGLVLIDQHAAHERVRFERLRAAAPETVASQRLLVPAVVEVGEIARARLLEAREELVRAGFEVEEFGDRALAVRAIPACLDVATDPRELLEGLAADLGEVGVSDRLASAHDALTARVACHGAVRVGEPLSAEEMVRLVADLDTIPYASTCPHGRPLLIQLERSEIERRVGRT